MFPIWKSTCVLVVLLAAAASVSPQSNLSGIHTEIGKILLKKDIRQAIKEAEAAGGNDLRSLLWRLTLYRRAAHVEKTALIVRQIVKLSPEPREAPTVSEFLRWAVKDPLFLDTRTLQQYLQYDFDDGINWKLIDLCTKQKQNCDIAGFDKWLAQKAQENPDNGDRRFGYLDDNAYLKWIARRIEWRKRFDLDTGEILSQFSEDVRKRPDELDPALLYLRFFSSVQDMNWLAQTFASTQAYINYEIGRALLHTANYSISNENDRRQVQQIAIRFLQRSLSLPFNEKDRELMWSRQLSRTSISPVVKNHDKQLRFWTKTELAEAYKAAGEPQNAQPIVEELVSLDKSDILSSSPDYLAGSVQAASGARVVESKLLLEEAARQDSYTYWEERVAYYRGRQEPALVVNTYLKSFAAVPFDISDKNSKAYRIHVIGRFADFVEHEFDGYKNPREDRDWNFEEKTKAQLWKESENFLRNEFEKTSSDLPYSYELAMIVHQSDFDRLLEEILARDPELLVNAAKMGLINDMENLLDPFFKLEKLSNEKKDLIAARIIKVADQQSVDKAWGLCEAIVQINEPSKTVQQIIPILVRNLKSAQAKLNRSQPSDENRSEIAGLEDKYAGALFRAYLSANDWRSAENLMMEDSHAHISFSFDQIIYNAAKNGGTADAIRYWKQKANRDRTDLEYLSSIGRFPAVGNSLREFYKQMKIDEPYSPIPDMALAQLK